MSLEAVEAIEWVRLDHAYGVAADVPELLRAVAAGEDLEESRRALATLAGRIHHDGHLYGASAPAVMFLVELGADATLEPGLRAGCLLLCGTMAGARAAGGDSLRKVARALLGVETTLRGLLADPEPSVRAATAALAGRIPGPPQAWAQPLRDLAAAAGDPAERALYEVAAALAAGRPPARAAIDLAASADPGARDWRDREASGLMGLRVSPGAAARLGSVLAAAVARREP